MKTKTNTTPVKPRVTAAAKRVAMLDSRLHGWKWQANIIKPKAGRQAEFYAGTIWPSGVDNIWDLQADGMLGLEHSMAFHITDVDRMVEVRLPWKPDRESGLLLILLKP